MGYDTFHECIPEEEKRKRGGMHNPVEIEPKKGHISPKEKLVKGTRGKRPKKGETPKNFPKENPW